jgi:hypothetical protein
VRRARPWFALLRDLDGDPALPSRDDPDDRSPLTLTHASEATDETSGGPTMKLARLAGRRLAVELVDVGAKVAAHHVVAPGACS